MQVVGDNVKNINMLLLGRIDLCIVEKCSAGYHFANDLLYQGEIKAASQPMFESMERLGIAKMFFCQPSWVK